MDFTVQKAVELGVAEIFPVEMRRSVMRLAEERAARRVDHWQNLVVAACEQCGRNRVPEVHPVSALPDWLGAHSTAPGEQRLILSTVAEKRLRDLAAPQQLLLADPRGSPEELEMAQVCGFTAVGSARACAHGTAAPALAAIQALGDLREEKVKRSLILPVGALIRRGNRTWTSARNFIVTGGGSGLGRSGSGDDRASGGNAGIADVNRTAGEALR
jgi:hypothetical protein